MILEVTIEGKVKSFLFGFEAVKEVSKSAEISEIEAIENIALIGLNTFEKRNQLELTDRDTLISWMDDMDTMLLIKDAVEAFSVNFTQKVSEYQKAKAKAKK